MVAFNKSDNQAVTTTGLSGASRGMPADDSLGLLFKGVGDTLQNAVNAYDESTKVKIQMAADEAVNGPNGAVAQATPDANGNLPPQAAAGIANIATLKAGLAQGTVSQVQFDTAVAQQAKRIRASVPAGYGPMVEQALSAAVGSSTANQQRQTTMAAIDEYDRNTAKAAGEADKNMREFLEAENNQKYLMSSTTQAYYKKLTGQDMQDFILNPDAATFNKVKLAVMYAKADETNAESALHIAENKQKLAGVQAGAVVGQVIGEVFSEKSKPYQAIISAMNSAWADKKITPDEAANLQNLYRDFRYNTSSSLAALTSQYNLSPDDRKKLADETEVRLKGLETALSDPTFGLLNATNNYFNSRVTAAGQQAVDRSKILFNIKVMQDQGVPPQVIAEYYAKNGGYGDLESAIGDGGVDVATGSTTVGDVLKNNKEAINDPDKMAKFTQGLYSSLTNLMASENQTPQGVTALAKNIFSEDNANMMALLPSDQRAAMFERMISPDVVNKIIASGDQETINAVQNWATTQFKAVSARAADNIIERQKYSYGLNFKFDGHQFTVEPRKQTTEEFATNMLPGTMEGLYERKAMQGMQDINRYIKSMEPLWKADGLDTATAMGMIMSENVNEVGKEPTVLMMLRDALFSSGSDKQSNAGMISGTAQASAPADGEQLMAGNSLPDADAGQLLGFISKAEGADYNTLFGGSKVDLSGMTVAEVQQMQRAHGKKTGSSATGAYQVIRRTLSGLIDNGIVDPDEKFTPEVQDKIGMALLKGRGYDDWKAGKISTEEFANNLASEWASLPTSSGKSRYHGDSMGNKATRSRGKLIAMLEELKNN